MTLNEIKSATCGVNQPKITTEEYIQLLKKNFEIVNWRISKKYRLIFTTAIYSYMYSVFVVVLDEIQPTALKSLTESFRNLCIPSTSMIVQLIDCKNGTTLHDTIIVTDNTTRD